jgi:hypothetical protein
MSETLIFFGVDAANQNTLWKSNGSASGTKPIINADIGVNTGGSLNIPDRVLLYHNNHIYIQAQLPNGPNLLLVWSAANPNPSPFNYVGNASDNLLPQGFTIYESTSSNLVYFNGTFATDSELTTVQELFATNGTQAGTTLIGGPVSGLTPTSLTVAFKKLFFSGYNGAFDSNSNPIFVLFSYDGNGTPAPVGVDVVNPADLAVGFAGTSIAIEVDPDLPFLPPPPQPPVFMSGEDASTSGKRWLYQYDGSHLTKIAPTSASSSGLAPYNLANMAWLTTRQVGPFDLALRHWGMFFSGVNHAGHRGLWLSMGTSLTTSEITMGGATISEPYNLTVFNDKLYFTANDSGGRGLFVYDPTKNAATEIIKSSAANLDPGIWQSGWEDLNQITMTAMGSHLYFSASGPTGSSGLESEPNLWRTDGTLNSHGQATPEQVNNLSNVGPNNSLFPWSLTTADI